MGTPKALLDWFGAPLVERQIESLLKAGVNNVYVVTGHRAYEVQRSISGDGVESVINPHYREGKSTSVKAGLAALPEDTKTIVLLAVDQPRPAWLIEKVLKSHAESGAPISSPQFEGHGGHPLVFDGTLMLELDMISEQTEGVRQVLREHADSVNRVPVDSPLARIDMNTPESYEEAKARYRALECPD
jgi:molybdenum cofactor cytidylyltransferase